MPRLHSPNPSPAALSTRRWREKRRLDRFASPTVPLKANGVSATLMPPDDDDDRDQEVAPMADNSNHPMSDEDRRRAEWANRMASVNDPAETQEAPAAAKSTKGKHARHKQTLNSPGLDEAKTNAAKMNGAKPTIKMKWGTDANAAQSAQPASPAPASTEQAQPTPEPPSAPPPPSRQISLTVTAPMVEAFKTRCFLAPDANADDDIACAILRMLSAAWVAGVRAAPSEAQPCP